MALSITQSTLTSQAPASPIPLKSLPTMMHQQLVLDCDQRINPIPAGIVQCNKLTVCFLCYIPDKGQDLTHNGHLHQS